MVWIISTIAINPYGEFPFNDDWAYARSVKALVETRTFFMSAWTSVNLLTQIGWGALFCLPFGFSFTALRISTLAAGLLGLWGTHRFIFNATGNSQLAFLGTLLMLMNPMYLGLSASFMTDVPFYTLVVWSLAFMVRGLKEDTISPLLIGFLLAIATLLLRQLGICLFVAFSMAYVIRKGVNLQSLVIAAMSISLGLGIQMVYQRWLKHVTDMVSYNVQATNFFSKSFYERPLIHDFLNNTFVAFMYTGVFLAPYFLILLTRDTLATFRKNIWLWISLTVVVLGFWFYFFQGASMPLWWNTINGSGLGPFLTRDFFYRLYSLPGSEFVHILMICITIGGLLGSVGILFYLIQIISYLLDRSTPLPQRSIGILLLAVTSIYYLPLGLQGLFDRYLLPLPALLLVLIHLVRSNSAQVTTAQPLRLPIYLALGLYVFCSVYNILITHDYMAWNRVRWTALNKLLEQGIQPTEIDGGLEFNGWYLYDGKYKSSPDKSFWWVHNDTYMLGASILPGFTLFQKHPVNTWLPYGIQDIYISKKNPVKVSE
ncbi:hypothetical protein [Spirosoma harenae]